MRLSPVSLIALLPSTYAFPVVDLDLPRDSIHGAIARRCGPVSAFFGQTSSDWNNNNLNTWLDAWWSAHLSDINAGGSGFAGAWGLWAIGNPDWTCRDDGSNSDCDFVPCDNRVLNEKGVDIREAYYVSESITRLHSYFLGISEGFEVSAIFAALSKDSWARTFYKDKDVKSATVLKEILNAVGTVIGIGGAFAGPVGGAMSSLFAGAVGTATPLIAQHQDDTFEKSADLGGILGNIVVEAMKSFTSANNILMAGRNYLETGDIRTYISGGAFVDFSGVDKNGVIDAMNSLLIGQAVNALWRTQKIFILGGGACGDNQGIGQGPQASSVCRDGKAWYLYYWQENDVISTTSHQWGWVNSPPGADQLGQGDYAGVTVQDVINSSLDSYNVAGYNYNSDTAAQRAKSALQDQWGNPGAKRAGWEGTFTIPVCDIGGTIGANLDHGEFILQDYGHDSRPVWCGPICSNSADQTKAFIAAAQMNGFDSPKHLCPDESAPY